MKIDEENCCVPLLGFQALTQSLMDNDSNEYLIDCKQETKLVIEKPEGVWSQTDLVSNQIRWNYVNSWLTLRDKREQFEFSLLVGEFAAKLVGITDGSTFRNSRSNKAGNFQLGINQLKTCLFVEHSYGNHRKSVYSTIFPCTSRPATPTKRAMHRAMDIHFIYEDSFPQEPHTSAIIYRLHRQ